MGNVFSAFLARQRATEDVESSVRTMSNLSASSSDVSNRDEDDREERIKSREEEMDQFKKQLDIKREQRKEILNRHRNEKTDLEKSLDFERRMKLEVIENNRILRDLLIKNNIEIPDNVQGDKEFLDISNAITQMKEEFEKLKTYNNKLRRDLVESNNALQNANLNIAELNTQNTESVKQIKALKDIVTITKTMVNLREQQLFELKNKLNEIEQSLGDREANMLSNDLRQEYIRQLQNIRTLRGLYEERARLAEVSRQGLVRELDEQRRINESEINKGKNLTARSEELENKITHLLEVLDDKNEQIAAYKDVSDGLKAEMSTINMLFAQVLLGYKTKQDLDKLIHRLEENHGLLTHMAENENGSEASSALPKLLLELVSQVDDDEECQSKTISKHENETIIQSNETTVHVEQVTQHTNTTPKEIVENLPKVWKVLMELLSHQNATDVIPEKVTTCYKYVHTKSGPVLVPSVSQTYIRLKDLIVEKLALIKEMNRMKQLNSHLATRLEEQEKRLGLVTNELSKTWHVVGRLRRHHHQLHTHEKILKYELQQKRKLLNELKEQLEYCREKWAEAREKNSQSEKDWKTLRAEFSSRKLKASSPTNNSGESGYSDEKPSDESSESNDESEYTPEPLTKSKKKNKNSYDVIIDSSTDHNLAAEQDDPPSDMIDVADLPLDRDTQDVNDVIPDYCNENNDLSTNELTCEEIEDEMYLITQNIHENNLDSSCPCNDDTNIVNPKIDNEVSLSTCVNDSSSSKGSTSENGAVNIIINASAILESIRQQNERLAKKDKKLEILETNTDNVLKKIQATNLLSNHINSTLDHIISRPSCSRLTQVAHDSINENVPTNPTLSGALSPMNHEQKDNNIKKADTECCDIINNVSSDIKTQKEIISNDEFTSGANQTCQESETHPNHNDKVIIPSENDAISNENVSTSTFEHYNDVVENVSSKLNTSIVMAQKFDKTTSTRDYDDSNIASTSSENNLKEEAMEPNVYGDQSFDSSKNAFIGKSSKADSGLASTSAETNHEVRFAARDLRLKRLEEQTKSLVKKMSNTATKGVKLHYKLEELHNIYGSEGSRPSTPDDSEDESTKPNEETQ